MFKKIVTIALFLTASLTIAQTAEMEFFGNKIDADDLISANVMLDEYNKLAVNDTLDTKFSAKVLEVCQAKGCWMKVELDNGKQAMVKFKDYGFFMPKDIAGKEVVMNGKAFVSEMSVDEQQHYAKDGGKTDAEIAKITEVKKTYSFTADGVLLKK